MLEYVVSTDLAFYALMVAAVIVLRWKAPRAERPYRALGYPVTPLVYIGLSVALLIDLVYLAPKTSGMGFLIMLSGLPVYYLGRAMRQPPPPS